MLKQSHEDQALARLKYFENHKRGTLKFFNFLPIPCPFFFDDGRVDWHTVFQHPRIVHKEQRVGTPRWCEWGEDVRGVKIIVKNFRREERNFYSNGCIRRVYAYVESSSQENIEKVKQYASGFLFGTLRSKYFGIKELL